MEAHKQGLDTLVVDLDYHSSTVADWAAIRTAKQPLVVTAQVSDIKELLQQAADENFDLLILDCPPYFTDDTELVTKLVDFTILPTTSRFADVCTLPRGIEKVHQPYSVVLNSCTPDNVGEVSFKTTQVRQVLEESDIPVSPVHVTRLEPFTDALSFGQGVGEYQPNGKAAYQVAGLLKWLKITW